MQPLFAEGVMGKFGQDFLLDSFVSNQGRVSISLFFRETKYGMEAEFLATGFADAPRVVTSHDFHGYLLPLAHGLLGAGSWWDRKADQRGAFVESVVGSVIEMASISKTRGGLRSVDLVGPNLEEIYTFTKDLLGKSDLEERKKLGRELREERQNYRFQLALSHYHQLIPGEGMQAGSATPLHEIWEDKDRSIAQLYTLARALGVKEIIPRIQRVLFPGAFGDNGEAPSAKEISVSIAKLKRNFVIPN